MNTALLPVRFSFYLQTRNKNFVLCTPRQHQAQIKSSQLWGNVVHFTLKLWAARSKMYPVCKDSRAEKRATNTMLCSCKCWLLTWMEWILGITLPVSLNSAFSTSVCLLLSLSLSPFHPLSHALFLARHQNWQHVPTQETHKQTHTHTHFYTHTSKHTLTNTHRLQSIYNFPTVYKRWTYLETVLPLLSNGESSWSAAIILITAPLGP